MPSTSEKKTSAAQDEFLNFVLATLNDMLLISTLREPVWTDPETLLLYFDSDTQEDTADVIKVVVDKLREAAIKHKFKAEYQIIRREDVPQAIFRLQTAERA